MTDRKVQPKSEAGGLPLLGPPWAVLVVVDTTYAERSPVSTWRLGKQREPTPIVDQTFFQPGWLEVCPVRNFPGWETPNPGNSKTGPGP